MSWTAGPACRRRHTRRSPPTSTTGSSWTWSSRSAATRRWPWRSTPSAWSWTRGWMPLAGRALAGTGLARTALTAPGLTSRKGAEDAAFREASGGELDRALPGAGHRPGRLCRLGGPGALRGRAVGDLPPDLAERGPGGAAAAGRQLLHQGARGGGHLADHRPGPG